MRLAVGLGICAVGVAALGWWARAEYAPFMQQTIAARAAEVVAGSVHGASAHVAGRDITVSGLADGAVEHDRLIAALDAVPGRRVVVDALEVLPRADPYTLSAVMRDGVVTAEGHAPGEGVRAALGRQARGTLTLAVGAPDASWGDAAMLGLAALHVFEDGDLTITGRSLTLRGTLRSPEAETAIRSALASLPEGYEVAYDLTFLDDGTPPAYRLTYAAATGARLEGKLPMTTTGADVAAALGLAQIDDAATVALTGEAGAPSPVLAALAPWLAEVETLEVSVSAGGTVVDAGFGAGGDLELLATALGADLSSVAQGLSLRLREAPATGGEGDRRRHAVTGRDEVLAGGFWLPAADFAPDAASCARESDRVLAASRIGFVTGSARLDARARGAVNALAGVLGPCLREAGLRAEIGGHTDATGDDEANLALSRARAEAVRSALLARGVPEAGIAAAGYGASQPVADNTTDEGRAANRRTAVRWIE